jgi:hypothetical protein
MQFFFIINKHIIKHPCKWKTDEFNYELVGPEINFNYEVQLGHYVLI